MFCVNCGKSLPQAARFCPTCGRTVAESAATPPRSESTGAGKVIATIASGVGLLIALAIGLVASLSAKKAVSQWTSARPSTTQEASAPARIPSSTDVATRVASATSSTVDPSAQMPWQRTGFAFREGQAPLVLFVRYASPFVLDPSASKEAFDVQSAQAPGAARSIAMYKSVPTCGLGEVGLVLASSEWPLSIDGAVQGSASQISKLPGITNPATSVLPTEVSGYQARLMSYQANRWGGALGMEALHIVDPTTNTYWQLQLIFESSSINDARFESTRSCAKAILATARIET
jgi:hypothetical protein